MNGQVEIANAPIICDFRNVEEFKDYLSDKIYALGGPLKWKEYNFYRNSGTTYFTSTKWIYVKDDSLLTRRRLIHNNLVVFSVMRRDFPMDGLKDEEWWIIDMFNTPGSEDKEDADVMIQNIIKCDENLDFLEHYAELFGNGKTMKLIKSAICLTKDSYDDTEI
eukprot:TRINITY_DN6643_c0_g1_i1.p1 TRINITY_DN6643_c0_g1~~TRINITY_DN6643_c0_g1_i1.p1  ORF type:complete len:164 (-),score=41.70 TRINITY_DN6643_c0_g1_i1:48-539(-)